MAFFTAQADLFDAEIEALEQAAVKASREQAARDAEEGIVRWSRTTPRG